MRTRTVCCVGEGRADGPFFVLAYLVTITELGTVIKSILMIMKTSLVCRTITRKRLVHFLLNFAPFLAGLSLSIPGEYSVPEVEK